MQPSVNPIRARLPPAKGPVGRSDDRQRHCLDSVAAGRHGSIGVSSGMAEASSGMTDRQRHLFDAVAAGRHGSIDEEA